MEERRMKVLLSKSGNGNINPRIPIPITWFKLLGLNEEEHEVIGIIDEEKKELIIKKGN